MEQQKPQPADEEAEVVSGCCENGIYGITRSVSEIVSVHPVLGFQMPYDGFDGRPTPHLAFDLGRHAPLLTGDEDAELVIGRRIVAAIPFVGDDALDGVADERLHLGMTVARVWPS